jgi:hypothetical protein
MSVRLVTASCLCAIALVALTACSSDGDDGEATVPSAEATATEPACPAHSRCYDFTKDAEGWPEVSDDQHFAGHDVYSKGSYRVGVREPGSWSMTAPLELSELSPGYGVQVDLDATPGRAFPQDAAWGATCWTRDLGGGKIAGFGAQVQPDALTIGVYDQSTGAFHPLQKQSDQGMSKSDKKSHLTLRCTLDTSSGSAVAKIRAQVDGSKAASVSYDHAAGHEAWVPADGLGLVAAGEGADVFYDQVVIAAH